MKNSDYKVKILLNYYARFLQDKADIFLELYGNSLIRETTENWLEDVATKFIKLDIIVNLRCCYLV